MTELSLKIVAYLIVCGLLALTIKAINDQAEATALIRKDLVRLAGLFILSEETKSLQWKIDQIKPGDLSSLDAPILGQKARVRHVQAWPELAAYIEGLTKEVRQTNRTAAERAKLFLEGMKRGQE